MTMETKGIILVADNESHFNSGLRSLIREAWKEANVAADDALFTEAYDYADTQLKRVVDELPQKSFQDLLGSKIGIQLGYLAQNGHFPPAAVETKTPELTALCKKALADLIDKEKAGLSESSPACSIALIADLKMNLKTLLNEWGLAGYFKEIVDVNDLKKPESCQQVLEEVIRHLGVSGDEVLIVSRSDKWLESGKKAGCQTLSADVASASGKDSCSTYAKKLLGIVDYLLAAYC